jgi:hypothetical protein
MKPREIDAAIADRFARWGKFLRDRNASPVLIMGLTHPDHQLVITTIDEMTDAQIQEALSAALLSLRAGMIEHATPERSDPR